MSYKHALALTAFGIGAVLQGCGEDEKKEKECTVGCQDKCKDIDGYEALTKVGVYEENCGICIDSQLSVEGATPIEKWAKVLAASIAPAANDVEKALPLQALQYCGAKQQATACGTPLEPVDHVSTKAGIDAAVLALDDPDCGFCYLLVAVTDCATGLTSLTACGNAPNFVCEQDYSCHDIAGAYNDLTPDTAVNTVCKSCLDAEVADDTAISGDIYTTAFDAVTAASDEAHVEALADHLLHCGAEQDDSSCGAGITLIGDTGIAIRTALLGQSGVCEVCVLMGEFADVDVPTCREMKTSLATCGATGTAQSVICPECADLDWAVDDTNCLKCMTEQQNDASPWSLPAAGASYATDAAYAPWLFFQTCGAVPAAEACEDQTFMDEQATPVALDMSSGSGNTVAQFQAAIAAVSENGCNACINSAVAQDIADNSADIGQIPVFQAAIKACSN